MQVDEAEPMRVIRDEPAYSKMFVSHILTRRKEGDILIQQGPITLGSIAVERSAE